MKTDGNRAFTAKKKYIFMTTVLVALAMLSCGERPLINQPGDNSFNLDSIPVLVPDTEGIEITIDSALAICKSLAINAETGESYKLTGVLTKNSTNPMTVPMSYDNINFELTDSTGSISCYYTNDLLNKPFRSNARVPRVGSKLTVKGVLTYYQKAGSSNPPTPELKNGFIVRIDSMVAPPPFPGCPDPDSTEISVTEAVQLALALKDKTESQETYNVLGVVTEVLNIDVSSYGNAEYIISDGKSYFYVYRGQGRDNKAFTKVEQLLPNDTVTVTTKLYNYGGIAETKANAAYIKKTTNPNW